VDLEVPTLRFELFLFFEARLDVVGDQAAPGG
jgi:hypothetical protein